MSLANAGLKSQAEVTLLFKTLSIIKQHPELQDIGLIKQSRLSVMPVTDAQFDIIMQLSDTKLH